mgnify:CR=1 FL=1
MATKDYVMPKLAMAMNEGTINEWLIESGEKVTEGQEIASAETEKVVYDLRAPQDGYLHITLPVGETVPVETQIGIFADTAEELATLTGKPSTADAATAPKSCAAVETIVQQASSNAAPMRAAGERIKSSPLARKMAKDNKLELSNLAGTGPGGRIVKRDIVNALANPQPVANTQVSSTQANTVVVDQAGMIEKARIPMKGMRKVISERMKKSFVDAAQLSCQWDCDITELLVLRSKFVAREESLGTRVSMNAFIIKAIATAIKQVPVANSCLVDNDVVIYDTINMGFAISVDGVNEFDKGLMVGVLHDVEQMGVVQIDKEIKALVHRIRNNEATADDLTGSTITLSSTAGLAPGGSKSTPVLNLPNAALVGTSTAKKTPVVVNDEIVIRTVMPISLTFDHCLFDGEPAARFSKALNDALENPELMLA